MTAAVGWAAQDQLNSKMILQSPTAPRAPSNPSKSKRDPQKGFYEPETTMRIQGSRMLQGYPGQGGMLSPEVSKNSSVVTQPCAKCQERDWLTQHFAILHFSPVLPPGSPASATEPQEAASSLQQAHSHTGPLESAV